MSLVRAESESLDELLYNEKFLPQDKVLELLLQVRDFC
jgi:hypothetical protein